MHLFHEQVEECLLDYATGLMGNKTTWTVAAEILAFCPRQGKPALEALLANLPVSGPVRSPSGVIVKDMCGWPDLVHGAFLGEFFLVSLSLPLISHSCGSHIDSS